MQSLCLELYAGHASSAHPALRSGAYYANLCTSYVYGGNITKLGAMYIGPGKNIKNCRASRPTSSTFFHSVRLKLLYSHHAPENRQRTDIRAKIATARFRSGKESGNRSGQGKEVPFPTEPERQVRQHRETYISYFGTWRGHSVPWRTDEGRRDFRAGFVRHHL